jgi:hypothetical protein
MCMYDRFVHEHDVERAVDRCFLRRRPEKLRRAINVFHRMREREALRLPLAARRSAESFCGLQARANLTRYFVPPWGDN